jgi:hypothetical protein
LSSITRVPSVSLRPQDRPPQQVSLGWAVRRALFGLAMLAGMVMLGAWLLYTSIDPDEASAGAAPQPVQSSPKN